jgi:hypothetical protein
MNKVEGKEVREDTYILYLENVILVIIKQLFIQTILSPSSIEKCLKIKKEIELNQYNRGIK